MVTIQTGVKSVKSVWLLPQEVIVPGCIHQYHEDQLLKQRSNCQLDTEKLAHF